VKGVKQRQLSSPPFSAIFFHSCDAYSHYSSFSCDKKYELGRQNNEKSSRRVVGQKTLVRYRCFVEPQITKCKVFDGRTKGFSIRGLVFFQSVFDNYT
jgi:hypothetical protein